MRYTIPIAAALITVWCSATAAEMLTGPYRAEIVRVIDGDTVEARIHVWLGLDVTTSIRIRDIDAPELRGDCPEAGAASRDHLIHLLGSIPVSVRDIKHDKYGGRVDAAIALPDGRDVAATQLAAGHAIPWPHPKGESPCSIVRPGGNAARP